MSIGIITVISSAGVLALLTILFHIEQRRNRRFLEGARMWFDGMIIRLSGLYHQLSISLGRDFFRNTFHYLSHWLLTFVLGAVRSVESRMMRLVHANRASARKAMGERTTRTKLDEMEEHKVEVTLTDTEKRSRKEHAIGTRL